jgi:hypothetical protein
MSNEVEQLAQQYFRDLVHENCEDTAEGPGGKYEDVLARKRRGLC